MFKEAQGAVMLSAMGFYLGSLQNSDTKAR